MTSQLAAEDVEYAGRKYKCPPIDSARMLDENVTPFRLSSGPKRGAKRRGVLYEARVSHRLLSVYPTIRLQPWFQYTSRGATSYIRPDAVLDHEWDVWLFEIKYSHCLDAYWQLTRHYDPVVSRAFGKPVRKIEIVKNLDSDILFPTPIVVSMDFEEFVKRTSYDLSLVEVIRWKI